VGCYPSLRAIELESPNPLAGKSIYVMSESVQRDFIDKQKLVVVYRGNFSDVVIAVNPAGLIRTAMVRP